MLVGYLPLRASPLGQAGDTEGCQVAGALSYCTLVVQLLALCIHGDSDCITNIPQSVLNTLKHIFVHIIASADITIAVPH